MSLEDNSDAVGNVTPLRHGDSASDGDICPEGVVELHPELHVHLTLDGVNDAKLRGINTSVLIIKKLFDGTRKQSGWLNLDLPKTFLASFLRSFIPIELLLVSRCTNGHRR